MGTKIVKPSTVEVIPSTKMEGLEEALAELQVQTNLLPRLKAQADAIIVTTPARFLEAGEVLTNLRSIKKAGDHTVKPYLEIAKRVMDYLRLRRTTHETEVEAIENPLSEKMNQYTRKEREAAEIEQRRKQEETRIATEEKADADRKEALRKADETKKARVAEIKAALKAGEIGKREAARLLKEVGALEEAAKEQADADAETAKTNVPEVKVLPNTPAVPGLRKMVLWKFRILDVARIPRKYMIPNETKIGADVRFWKDKAKAEAEIPGIEVYTEDSI